MLLTRRASLRSTRSFRSFRSFRSPAIFSLAASHVPRLRLVDEERLRADTQALLRSLRHPARRRNAEVSSLSVAEQQMVEIARALSAVGAHPHPRRADCGSFAQGAGKPLCHHARSAERGILILYVSHRLQEIVSIADRGNCPAGWREGGDAPILGNRHRRSGRTDDRRRTVAAAHDAPSLVGRLFEITYRSDSGLATSPFVAAKFSGSPDWSGPAAPRSAGRSPAVPVRAPSVALADRWLGRSISASPHAAMRAGIVYLTEDRKRDGIFPSLDIVSNAVASALPHLAQPASAPRRERRATAAMLEPSAPGRCRSWHRPRPSCRAATSRRSFSGAPC